MKHVWVLLWALVMMGGVSDAASITRILGGSIDNSTPPGPTGLCTGIFNMTQVGYIAGFTFNEATNIQTFGIAPRENSFEGQGYFQVFDSAGGNVTRIYRIALPSFTIASRIFTDIASNPDSDNTQQASHYNSFTNSWVKTGIKAIAPDCNLGLALNCLHVRTYDQLVLNVDVLPLIGQSISSGIANFTYDSEHTYLSYVQSTGTAGVYLGKFVSGSYAFVNSVRTDAATQFSSMTNDSTYIYATFGTNTIHRFLKSNITTGATIFTPGINGGTPSAIRYDSINNLLYVSVVSAGLSPNFVYRVDPVTMLVTGTITYGNSIFPREVMVDTVNNKVYVGLNNGGTAGVISRVTGGTLVQEASFGTLFTPNGPQYWNLDIIHQDIYLTFAGGGGALSQIQKVNLCE